MKLAFATICSVLTLCLNAQNHLSSNWSQDDFAQNPSWYVENGISHAVWLKILPKKGAESDTSVYATLEYDSINSRLTQIFYANGKPMASKFNHVFQFDSLNQPFLVHRKVGELPNHYKFDLQGRVSKENQWTYSYDSLGRLSLLTSDTMKSSLHRNNWTISFHYKDSMLKEEVHRSFHGSNLVNESIVRFKKLGPSDLRIEYFSDIHAKAKQEIRWSKEGFTSLHFDENGVIAQIELIIVDSQKRP